MVFAYRMAAPNPAAWITGGAVSAPVEQVLPIVLDPRFDPARAAVIDTGSALPPRPLTALAPVTGSARVTTYAPGSISIDLSAPAADGAVLVVSENYYPGWTATAGSTRLTTSRVNYNLIGVGLTAGTRHVDLTFVDPAYARGKSVTIAALLVAVGLIVGGIFVDRRRAGAPAHAAA